ncbi:Hypothetical protein CAP_4368 [Chondromyces apiculatus DSM 436]|uniref:Uncharacterized protein n=1 Tax=Chondromyces apiculatus DSM 436 TaxID=1192034 RepID=A0A017T5M9_9BACT|nr:Hypothetical protein CAP_4368 [Chondromyces apiculatus DSM 436]
MGLMKRAATGHRLLDMPPESDLSETMIYIREAESLGHQVGDAFPPLPPARLVSLAESSEGSAC